MTKDLYDIGEAPPLGIVPPKMHAWLIREERFGEPMKSFQKEVVDVPEIKDDEVLVYVMAAGVNYNNVWSALGTPVNVIQARQKQGEKEDFHIGGSDASGIVYKTGKSVTNVKVGDEVVIHCGSWSQDCPMVQRGEDPMFSPTFRIWGYETNYGSFAQFTRVQGHQCLPKPKHLSWEAAASYMLVGATAYRMFLGLGDKSLKKDDVTLIWGGAGGLGSMAIQIAKAVGAIPIAVVSNDNKFEYCESLGAKGCINRTHFDHWGMLPHWKDTAGYAKWFKGVRKFGKALWDVLGEKRAPRIVFEHPGEATIPTSLFVAETGGIVVICAGTTGYNATVDLRYLWMRQKRVQGSHFANDVQADGFNRLVIEGLVDPCLSKSFTYNELPLSHQLMYENKHPHGNMGVLVGATEFGLGISEKTPHPSPFFALSTDDTHDKVPPYPLSTPTPKFITEPLETLELELVDDGTLVRDLMHPGLVTCSPSDSVKEVATRMVENDIHAVVVVYDAEPVGVVSQTDMVLARQGRSADAVKGLKASDIMTPGCVTCTLDTSLSDAVSTMTGLRIHRLIVTRQDHGQNVPIGVISMTDIIRKLVVDAN